MAALYELTESYVEALALLDAAETEDEEAAAWAALDAIEGDITDKAEAYARIIQTKQAEARAFAAEKTRLMACQRAAEGAVEGLKARLLESMQRLGVRDIQTGIGKWRVQLNPPRCEVTDADAVPEAYRIPQPDAIDRAGILKHYRATGELLPGVEITQAEGLRFR